MTDKIYDVIIAGSGPAGSATAISLARAGISCLLLDKSKGQAFKIGEGLPPVGKRMLVDLGIWDEFLKGDHLPSFGNQSAWGTHELMSTDFIHDPNGHGWHLDRVGFDNMLRAEAAKARAEVVMGAELNKVEEQDDGTWKVDIRADKSIEHATCKWLVDATGRSSRIARKIGVKRHSYDNLTAFFSLYEQHANATADEDSYTLIEAAEDGWWYSALLPHRKRVVAFFTDTGTKAGNLALSSSGFTQLLEQTEHVFPKLHTHDFEMVQAPYAAPANSSCLQQFSGTNWLAVGDAASAFDPLSSQGILTSMYHGIKAGEAIKASLNGDDYSRMIYENAVKRVFETYLQNRTKYYQFEQRWFNAPFWRERQQEAEALFIAAL